MMDGKRHDGVMCVCTPVPKGEVLSFRAPLKLSFQAQITRIMLNVVKGDDDH
jgi:hypothetical protein